MTKYENATPKMTHIRKSFGIVTSVELRVYEVPDAFPACNILYDAADAKRIMARFRDHQWVSPLPLTVGTLFLDLLQTESGINAAGVGERIGLSQSACWRRIQRLREEGVIKDRPVVLDREKVGLTTMVFAHVKLTSHGRSNLSAFAEAVKSFPEVLDCYVLLGNVDFLLRIVAEDIKAYEQFFFEKLSQLPGIQEVTSSIVLSETKHTRALPI